MLIEYSQKSIRLQQRLQAFMEQHIYPNEDAYSEQLQGAENRFSPLSILCRRC